MASIPYTAPLRTWNQTSPADGLHVNDELVRLWASINALQTNKAELDGSTFTGIVNINNNLNAGGTALQVNNTSKLTTLNSLSVTNNAIINGYSQFIKGASIEAPATGASGLEFRTYKHKAGYYTGVATQAGAIYITLPTHVNSWQRFKIHVYTKIAPEVSIIEIGTRRDASAFQGAEARVYGTLPHTLQIQLGYDSVLGTSMIVIGVNGDVNTGNYDHILLDEVTIQTANDQTAYNDPANYDIVVKNTTDNFVADLTLAATDITVISDDITPANDLILNSDGEVKDTAGDAVDGFITSGVTDFPANTKTYRKVLAIGPWDMDSTVSVTLSEAGTTIQGIDPYKIIQIKAIIREDGETGSFTSRADFLTLNGSETTIHRIAWGLTGGNSFIDLDRATGGYFDGPLFNDTAGSYNRGWLIVDYYK